MTITKRKVTVYICERCGHEWIPRDALASEQELPTVCPRCKNPYWNRPRKDGKKTKPKKR